LSSTSSNVLLFVLTGGVATVEAAADSWCSVGEQLLGAGTRLASTVMTISAATRSAMNAKATARSANHRPDR
jgi:hypothetical protein